MAKSLTFEEKLDNRFAPSPIVADFDILLSAAADTNSFQSPDELANYLSEGALLQLNKIGSQALSIPCGEYMVWTTDRGNTMLVPTDLKAPESEVFEDREDQYELFTPDLLNNFNCFGKAILESEEAEHPNFQDNEAETGGEEEYEGEHGGFQSKIHMNTVDRTPIARAMEQKGFTVTSLAQACGVDPPAISRILRTPQDTVGDPGGRNPSMGLAAKISAALKMDAEALFPDIFNVPKQDFQARETPGNRGSGMSGAAKGSARKGKATAKWTQGAQNEDVVKFTQTAKKLVNDA
jgi:transcriptional regulator with XRE-family HTH domain